MEKEINIAEILNGCPKGTKLYSQVFGDVMFEYIEEGQTFPIKVIDHNLGINRALYFDEYGRGNIGNYIPSKECILFPSRDQRDWNKFSKPVTPPFEIKRINGDVYWYIGDDGGIYSSRDGGPYDRETWDCGNYFNTIEQAKYAAKKIKQLFLSLRKEASNE